jgi:pyruvate/2-oxoglutarate dehydrogenase complex dihydrolipoamide dehydrogenase (E3) component
MENDSMENTSSAQLPKKTDPEEYDLVILGGGTGSTIAAWTFARQGQRVAAIDRKYVGGSCPNIACLPSKNIIHSAKVASYFRRSEEFGIAKKDFTVDMSAVRGRKRAARRDADSPDPGGGSHCVVLLRTFGAKISRCE